MSTAYLIESVHPDEQAAVLKRFERLAPSEQRAALHALRDEVIKRCTRDGWFFATNFVLTRDEADAESVKRFPDLPYLRQVWNVLVTNQLITVAKSRQMFISWLLCVFCVWFARFHPNKAVYWQTQKDEDANAMVCLPGSKESVRHAARMQFILSNLPPWLAGRYQESEGKIVFENGSVIIALAGGANQIRGKTPSLIIEDEFAFQPEAKGVYQALAPLIQKATKFVAVSTPNGTTNQFAELFFGHPVGQGVA